MGVCGGGAHKYLQKIKNSNTMHVSYYVHKYHRLWIYPMEILHVPYKYFKA